MRGGVDRASHAPRCTPLVGEGMRNLRIRPFPGGRLAGPRTPPTTFKPVPTDPDRKPNRTGGGALRDSYVYACDRRDQNWTGSGIAPLDIRVILCIGGT